MINMGKGSKKNTLYPLHDTKSCYHSLHLLQQASHKTKYLKLGIANTKEKLFLCKLIETTHTTV